MPFTHTNAMHVLFIHKNKHDDSKNKRYRITHMPPFVLSNTEVSPILGLTKFPHNMHPTTIHKYCKFRIYLKIQIR